MRHSPFSGDKGLRGAVSEIEMGLAPSGCRVLGIGWAKTRGRAVAGRQVRSVGSAVGVWLVGSCACLCGYCGVG